MIFTAIDDSLPDNMQLIHPLIVRVQEDGEILISEPIFYIHSSGPTLADATVEFKRVLVDELNELTHDEIHLAPRLQRQLQYLRSVIQQS